MLTVLNVSIQVTSGIKLSVFKNKKIKLTVKHGGAVKIHVQSSVCDFKLKPTWAMQQNKDPKDTRNSTSKWLKKNQ